MIARLAFLVALALLLTGLLGLAMALGDMIKLKYWGEFAFIANCGLLIIMGLELRECNDHGE